MMTEKKKLNLVDADNLKIVRSFRLSPEAVNLLIRAADESGRAQGEMIEECIIERIESVLAARRVRRSVLTDSEAVTAVAGPKKGMSIRKQN
jgi:hypothetical protein